MVNDFVIHLNRLREGNKKSTKTSLLLAPAMRDGEAINDQVFTFTFAGDDPLRFIGSNMLLRHELHTNLASDFLPAFTSHIRIVKTSCDREKTLRLPANKRCRKKMFYLFDTGGSNNVFYGDTIIGDAANLLI